MPGERIHVLLASSTLGYGGAERVAVHLLRHFDRDKLKLTLMVETGGPLLPLVPEDVDVIELNFPRRIPHTLSGPFLVAGALRRLAPQVILTNLLNMNFYCVFGKFFSRSKAKLVIVDHAPLSMQSYSARSSRLIRKLVPWFYPLADKLVGVSNGITMDTGQVVGRVDHKLATIYNPGWDDELLQLAAEPRNWEACGLDPGLPLLLSIARVVPQKDHRTLLEALILLKDKHGIDAQLAIVGSGDVAPLAALAAERGVGGRVKFFDAMLNPYPFYKRADVFVLSSRYEGFGMVIIEAMALGCPVVSTDCPHGPSEVLEGGQCGVLVPVKDPEALAEAIYNVLTNEGLRDALVTRARKRADVFRAEASARRYDALIMGLLENE